MALRTRRFVQGSRETKPRRAWNVKSLAGTAAALHGEGIARRRSDGGKRKLRGLPANAFQSKTYHKLSNFYDRIFTPLLSARIHATIHELLIPEGAKVLDVGVGTGSSLRAYPSHCDVVGIDLSHEMLKHAREKVQRNGWRHIQLEQMDALNLKFPSQSFDFVMAFHIAAVVPDPLRFMREITRVCKPGGTIAIINHLRSEDRWIGRLLDLIDPVTNRLGWQTTLRYEDLVHAAPFQVVRRFKTSPHSLFTVVIGTRNGDQPETS